MHRDLIDELAQEFQSELLTCGVESHTIARMIERSIKKAVECGSHMAIGDVWKIVGGSSSLAPDVDTVVAAVRALKPTEGNAKTPATVTAIERAVLSIDASSFSASGGTAEECRARVARYVANEFTAPEAPADAGDMVQGKTLDLDSDRKIWVGKRDSTTCVSIDNKKHGSPLQFSLSPEATKALAFLLFDAEFPDSNDSDDGQEPKAQSDDSDPVIGEAYKRDWEKSVRAIAFWAKSVPEIEGLCPENAIYTLAGTYLTLRDSMRDQSALGWIYRDSATGLRAFTQELPEQPQAGDYRAVYGVPLDISYVAASAARWLTLRELLSAPADDKQRVLFEQILGDLPAGPESVDLALDTIMAKQTATKAQWIRRYAAHCVASGHTAEQANVLAESTYDPEHWQGVTPEAAAEQDLAQLRTDGAV
jgi:hypothetical protein